MKLDEVLNETTIKSAEGSIQSSSLDKMISAVMTKYEIDTKLFKKVKATVIDDYADSDISQVTSRDILEVIDASGIT